MRKVLFALILVLFVVGCKGNNITGGAAVDVKGAITKDSCEETDNGINIESQGQVAGYKDGEEYGLSDNCLAGLLIEYYCENSQPLNQNIRCSGKCLKGACV